VFSHPDVVVVLFVIIIIIIIVAVVELVKFFCAHHVDGHLQVPVKKPPAVFNREGGRLQRNSVRTIEENNPLC